MPARHSPSADEKRTRKRRIWLLTGAAVAFLALLLGSIWRSDNVRRSARIRVADSAGRAVVGRQVAVKFHQWFGRRQVLLGTTDSLGYVSTAALKTPWQDWAWLGYYEASCFLSDQALTGTTLGDKTVVNVEALGSVSVQLVDPDGQPWIATGVENATAYCTAGKSAFDSRGRATFDHVTCNTRAKIRVDLHDLRFHCEAERQSPSASGENVELTITVPQPELMVRGRIEDARGQPRQGRFHFNLKSHLGKNTHAKVTTKEDGSFSIYSESRIHPISLTIAPVDGTSRAGLSKTTEEQPTEALDFGTFTLDG
ncbi:MAG: hypothetical protein AB8H80_23570 [Planctomycetota bacterium]